MAREVHLWHIDDRQQLRPLAPVKLDLEERLEAWLERDIGILDPDLLVIGRQVPTDHTGAIDILCIDPSGDLVIVEVKRDRTPREVTAQALDYASWVQELSAQRIQEIAAAHFGTRTLADAFQARFKDLLPEKLNEDHRMIVVGSRIDDATERIIQYLSDTHGVRINAATFDYFKDGANQYLARVFLIQPEAVEARSRTKGSSKRRPDYTPEEWAAIAKQNGVEEKYRQVLGALERVLQPRFGVTMVTLAGAVGEANKALVNLLPLESTPERGLCFQIYTNRLGTFLDLPAEAIEQALPPGCEAWRYKTSGSTDPEWDGVRGFLADSDAVDRLVSLFTTTGRPGAAGALAKQNA